MTNDAYLTERKNRRMLAERAYQLVSTALQVEDFDDSTLVTYQDGFHIQFGFSAMHPLLVMCLVRPMSPPAEEQLDMINDLNLNTVLGSHSINRATGCYSFRVTQWLDAELTEQRLFEILQRALEEAKKGYSILVSCA